MATITSITGLQNLTNLTSFTADFSGLASVDLSGMANLTYVDISDCDIPDSNTPSLTSVNLSGCTSLETLLLDDSNFSAGLPDLSDCTALLNIDFDDCRLSGSIDITNLPVLERADFSLNSQLTEVIISRNQPLGDNGRELAFNDCALTQTAVDNILLELATGSVSNGYVDLDNNDGGANAAPGQVGRDSLFILDSRGWSFDVANGNNTLVSLAYETTSGSICASTNISGYYIASGSSLTIGNKIYTNSDAWNPVLNGFYATGSVYYQVSGSGLIISTGSCV